MNNVFFTLIGILAVPALGCFGATLSLVGDPLGHSETANGAVFVVADEPQTNQANVTSILDLPDNSTLTSAAVPLTAIPIVTSGGIDYFEFVFDGNEPGSGAEITLTEITILNAAGGGTIYDFDTGPDGDSSITLDATAAGSNKADMHILIPLSSFSGMTASDSVNLRATSIDASAGDDEFFVRNPGPGVQFLPPGANVPEPSVGVLVLIGAALLGLRRTKR